MRTSDLPLPYYAGVDGLRAISVLAVLLFHAEVAGASGGFLGVESFFVISGFLITSILAHEHASTGAISIAAFYVRRARRLLPALALVLVGTLVFALVFAPDAWQEVIEDLPASALYASNLWRIVQQDAYFVAVDRPPLLLHLWSLAVEEQFYVVWPLAFAWLVRKLGAPGTGLFACFIACASLVWSTSLFEPQGEPSRIYYGTDTRLSGLMLGAALALLTAQRRAASVRASRLWDALGVVGLAVLCFSFTRRSSASSPQFQADLLAVDLATVAVIASVTHARGAITRLLSAPPLVWLGLRSYGLYLWHWPIFAITRPELDLTLAEPWLMSLRLGASIVCAELSYRVVEEPLRRGGPARSAVLTFGTAAVTLVGAYALRNPQAFAVNASPVYAAASVESDPARLEHTAASSPSHEPAGDDIPTMDFRSPRAATVAGVTLLPLLDDPRGPAERVGVDARQVGRGIPLDPRWPKTLTLLTDSVGLGLRQALPQALPDFSIEIVGRPALMVKRVVPDYLVDRRVGSVVVVALGHNSLFRQQRQEWDRWSGAWDYFAEELIRDVRMRGAKKIVWITLREPSPAVVTEKGLRGYRKFAWFFPYVNERIFELARRRPEIAIADWEAISDVPGLHVDLMHLNAAGKQLMAQTIAGAVRGGVPLVPSTERSSL